MNPLSKSTQVPGLVQTKRLDHEASAICEVCGKHNDRITAYQARSNVRRYKYNLYSVWRCASCSSLHCEKLDNYPSYYKDYPIRRQRPGYFLDAWHTVILSRLTQAGMNHSSKILDFGCGSGLFLEFLKRNGYTNTAGFDPFIDRYKSREPLSQKYDAILTMDVIEHELNPNDHVGRLATLLKPGGLLCIETPNAEGIDLDNPEEFIHSLHLPYHVHILSKRALIDLCAFQGLAKVIDYDRWYMDAWKFGTSRRFIECFMKTHGNDMDSAFDPPQAWKFLRHPSLILYFFFGYLLPLNKRDHMMIFFRKH